MRDEKEYKEYGLSDNKLSSDNLINYILKYPKLLQRPILVITQSSNWKTP